MTGNIFFDCVFLFLICYALINIFYNLSDMLLRRYSRFPNRSFLVLKIKHQSESQESDLRCAISKSLAQKCALLIICTDLSMEEYNLVWRLTDVYEHIILTTLEDLPQKLDTAVSISALQ